MGCRLSGSPRIVLPYLLGLPCCFLAEREFHWSVRPSVCVWGSLGQSNLGGYSDRGGLWALSGREVVAVAVCLDDGKGVVLSDFSFCFLVRWSDLFFFPFPFPLFFFRVFAVRSAE